MTRPQCTTCSQPAAINYYKNNRTYYRKQCEACLRAKRNQVPEMPQWTRAGYKKLMHCEKCGFAARFGAQLEVRAVGENNYKTVCLNCNAELDALHVPWIQTGLRPDN